MLPSLRGEFADGRSKASPDSGTARADKSTRTEKPKSVERGANSRPNEVSVAIQ